LQSIIDNKSVKFNFIMFSSARFKHYLKHGGEEVALGKVALRKFSNSILGHTACSVYLGLGNAWEK
jgi:hypothetical protein